MKQPREEKLPPPARVISILGSTGSVGRQALEVAEHLGLQIAALACQKSAALAEEQVRRYRPKLFVMYDPDAAADLKVRIKDTPVRVLSGEEGLVEAAGMTGVDTVLLAMSGTRGLPAAVAAIKPGRRLALANKEVLVCAGSLVMEEVRRTGCVLLPVDSEHSAIFQCLEGVRDERALRRIVLTASGGPFFGWSAEELEKVTPEQALHHPSWSMGEKITVDSATLMNKALEMIEACWLFDVPHEQIDVLVHRESIVHSMVEFSDGSVLAQLGVPDMRLPIQLALTWPQRVPSAVKPLDLAEVGTLHFGRPDTEAFPALHFARRVMDLGGLAGAAFSAAGDEAVGLFLRGELPLTHIAQTAMRAAQRYAADHKTPTLEDILACDKQVRAEVRAGMR